MSFRPPRTPRIITLFHDPQSSVSQRVLSVLQRHAQPARASVQGGPRSSDGPSPAQAYLDEAASAIEDERPFELEVVDRSRATPDQWRVISTYLHKRQPKQTELYRLKEEFGPFVVDWDQGKVVRTEQEAEQLAKQLAQGSTSSGEGKGSSDGKCIIM